MQAGTGGVILSTILNHDTSIIKTFYSIDADALKIKKGEPFKSANER